MRDLLALWAFFAVIFLVGCNGEFRDFDVTQYEKATVVGTIENSKDKINIKTSTGVNVTVYLSSIDSVSLRFQDEKKERGLYHTHFIYSAETRQPGGKDLLFVKIAGAYITRLNEWDKEEKIFVYNLSTRKLIGWAKVN